MMKRVTSVIGATSVILGFAISEGNAMPAAPSAVSAPAPIVEQARLYCYNRYSGRFLHWGPCGGGYYRPYYRRNYYRRYW